MTAAGLLAEKSPDKNSKEQKGFHNHQFTFATTIAHEITHLFGTFLGLGKIATPPREGTEEVKEAAKDKQPAEDKEPNQDDGPPEGGEYMEEAVFGGRVNVMKDPLDNAEQVGLPLSALVESPEAALTTISRPVYLTWSTRRVFIESQTRQSNDSSDTVGLVSGHPLMYTVSLMATSYQTSSSLSRWIYRRIQRYAHWALGMAKRHRRLSLTL